ncbi:hypothetical protein BH23PLA1_BH23PLA1_19170 [soil metagenome]
MLLPSPKAGASPTFCPRCRKPGRADSRLCADCGETLINQGFCPTCEAHWRLPAGKECPKHDQPLLPKRPVGAIIFGEDEVIHWETVASFAMSSEAEAARLRLDAEGLPAFLVQPFHGGVRLQVPHTLLQEARVLLSQSWAAPFDDDVDEEDDPDDGDESPKVAETDWRTAILAWVTLLVIAVLVLGILGWAG